MREAPRSPRARARAGAWHISRGSVRVTVWRAREYERESRAGDSRNATVARAFGRDARVGDSYK